MLGEETNDFHISKREIVDLVLPPTLEPLQQQIKGLLSYAISSSNNNKNGLHNDLWPTTLLHGITGSGKFSLAYALALDLGLNFHSVNAVNIVGDSSAFVEAKLKSLGEKIKAILPCLIYIRNVDVRLVRDDIGTIS